MSESLGAAIARVIADAIAADKTILPAGHHWDPLASIKYVTGDYVTEDPERTRLPLPASAPPDEPCQGCGVPQQAVLIPGGKWVVPNPCLACAGVGAHINQLRAQKVEDPGEAFAVLERRAGLMDERLKRARHSLERHGQPTYERIERADSFTYIESPMPTRYLVAAAQKSIRQGQEEGRRSVMALRTDWWLADMQASWSDERIKVPRASQLYTHDHVLLELRDPLGGWKNWAEEEVLGLIVARYNAMKMTTLISPASLDDWLASGSKLGAALRQVVPNEGGF